MKINFKVMNCKKLFCVASIMVISGGGHAQEGEEGFASLEEITVTAQKREENILEVPVSASVFGEADIATLRIDDTADFIQLVPSVTFSQVDANESTVSIRGISNSVGGITDTVTASIDGLNIVGLDTSYFYTNSLLDIERIEVLRGPQGTLSGGNSLGGSINYVTNKPDPGGFSIDLTADIGRFDSQFGRIIMNVPLADNLAVRAVAFNETSDGAVTNAGPSGGSSSLDAFGGRVAIRWLPSDALTLDFSLTAEEKDWGLPSALPVDVYFSDNQRDSRIATLTGLGGDYFVQDFLEDDGIGNNGGNVFFDHPYRVTAEFWLAQFNAEYDFDNHTLTAAFAKFDWEGDRTEDRDRSEFPVAISDSSLFDRSESLEIKLASNYDGRFNWLAGVFYLNEENQNASTELAGDGVSSTSYVFDVVSADSAELERSGIYGSIFFDFTDRLRLTAGLRFNQEKVGNVSVFGFDPIYDIDTVEPDFFQSIEDFTTETTDNFVPRIALNYDVSDNLTTYFQYAQGIRSGFSNPELAVDLDLAEPTVDEEELTNYEFGMKGRFFDNRLGVNLAMYYADFSSLQVGNFEEISALNREVIWGENVSDATLTGYEVEIIAQLNENLFFSFNYGYIDSEIDELDGENNIPFPNTRPESLSSSIEYTAPNVVPSGIDAFFRADYIYRDETYEGTGRDEADLINSFSVVDLSMGINAADWSVTAYLDNAFDEEYWLSNTTGGSLRGTFNYFQPRSYGIRFNYRFGN